MSGIDTKPKPCYRDRDNGVRFIKNGHHHECSNPECKGCTVCPERRHCTAKRNCSWHLPDGQMTCGRCVGDGRRELTWIGDLAALMPVQSITDGIGSQAAYLAGPVADARDWRAFNLARRHRITTHLLADRITEEQAIKALETMDPDDERHPERVLSTWALMIAEDYHHALPERLTLSWCVAYLDRQLHRIANDDEQDYPLLKSELKDCRKHMEAVLHNNDQRDRGAPCPTCKAEGKIQRLERQYAHWCEREECQQFHFTDDGSDVWRCPRDAKHWWTMQGYADVLAERMGA